MTNSSLCNYFLVSSRGKRNVMKHGAGKYIGFAGCEKTPVAILAPVCFGIDINFV